MSLVTSLGAPDVSHFADIQGLSRLRQQAAEDPAAAASEAAVQFEALLIQDLLSAARLTDEDLPLMAGHTSQYQSMFEQQVALDMARKGGLGLADHILRGLDGAPGEAAAARGLSGPAGSPLSEQQQFVRELMPLARRIGRELGVSPRLVLAQAALETGWGNTTSGEAGGRARNNFFGIKATSDWQGSSVDVQTMEFRDGVALRERASFRAYDSAAASFADYEKVLQQPRYVQARQVGDDAKAFGNGLVAGGYATDPAYADKLAAIADSKEFRKAVRAAETAQGAGLRADNRNADRTSVLD